MELPSPQSMSWSISDLDGDSAGRNQLGEMFRDRIAVKRKLECKWSAMDSKKMSELLSAVSDVFFTLTYPDALTGAMRSMTCYVGDRSVPMLRFSNSGKWLWENVSFSFVEK